MAKTPRKILAAKEWPLAKIKPYPHNPRTHPKAQIELLARLFLEHGVDQPIVVDEDGVILKGHGRLQAAHEAKLKTFPVVQRLGLNEDDKTAIRISDNQAALLSGWDTELIRFEITKLQRTNFDITLLGFGDKQLVEFTTKPGPPNEFQAVGDDIAVEHACPKCGFVWSGSSAPPITKDQAPKKSARQGRGSGDKSGTKPKHRRS